MCFLTILKSPYAPCLDEGTPTADLSARYIYRTFFSKYLYKYLQASFHFPFLSLAAVGSLPRKKIGLGIGVPQNMQ